MKPTEHLISRPAKIKFRDGDGMQEGFILLVEREAGSLLTPQKKSQFTFQFNNTPQIEKAFDFFDVDMITFM